MSSETSVANGALTLLGERRISSIDENSKTAKLLKERYDEVRDELLRAHPWGFATKRASIAKDTTAPTFGFTNAYTLPTDFLRLIEVNNQADWIYRVEGGKVVTDLDSPLEIVYTAQITNTDIMDVMFRQTLSAALAADLAEAFTGTEGKVDQINEIFKQRLRAARTPDGQEHSPSEMEASEWDDARSQPGYFRTTPSGPGTPL